MTTLSIEMLPMRACQEAAERRDPDFSRIAEESILALASMPDSERELHYVKGILRNRVSYLPYDVFKRLKYALEDGVSVEDMKLEAKHASSWSKFEVWLVGAREDARG